MTDNVLQDKYRPRDLADVVGQEAATSALRGLVARGAAKAFLLSGPSGTGKTTLSRIVAKTLGCDARGVLEIDAATKTGVDDMRKVQETLQYKPFGKSQSRAIIVDECHRLSGQAWDSMLKVLEEPPAHVFWFLCTTAPNKVPKTVKTRCASIQLKPVSDTDLRKLLDRVLRAEKLAMERDVREVVIGEAGGSPRQLLVNAAVCAEARTRREAAELLRSAHESDDVRELCRFLMQPGSWQKAGAILAGLEHENPESVRIAVCNYIGGALRNAKSDKEATRLLSILDEFAQPYVTAERAMLALSVGRVVFQ